MRLWLRVVYNINILQYPLILYVGNKSTDQAVQISRAQLFKALLA